MNTTQLFCVEGPWPGKLALAARPRGGDWLEDEMAGWQRKGINTVFSLLTEAEETALGLRLERTEATSHGMRFLSFSIEDRQVPTSPSELAKALENIEDELKRSLALGQDCCLKARPDGTGTRLRRRRVAWAPLMENMDGVTAKQAAAQPVRGAHSILGDRESHPRLASTHTLT